MPDVELSDDLEQWRRDVAAWLADHVVGDYATLKGRGGPGDEEYGFDLRVEWERELGKAGFIGLGWPTAAGGRGASLMQQVIWSEEYTRAQAPVRVSHIAEHLLAPTVIAFGTPEMQERFLPPILRGDERWCQGYSEPNAGSDLANVATKAVLDGDEWVINGQKVWTSLAQWAQWCFVIARTEAGSQRHKGLSFLLVPMDQPGIEIRPIIQITGWRRVQRGVLHRRAHERGSRRRRSGRGLARRDGPARLRARGVDARAAAHLRARARGARSTSRARAAGSRIR